MTIDSRAVNASSRQRLGRILFPVLLILGVALFFLPSLLPLYYVVLATEAMLLGLLAMSLDLLLGYTGLLSFGHAAFFGLGAYISAWILSWHSVSFPLVLIIAFLANFVLGLGVGLIAIQARGIYFAMITLAVSEVIHWTLYDLRSISGGDNGIVGIIPSGLSIPGVIDVSITSPDRYFYLTTMVVALCYWLLYRFTNSPFGSVLRGIRENENRSLFIGYPIKRCKLLAVGVSTGVAGLAGALYSPLYGFASPHLMEFHLSGKVILMTLLGGVGTLIGPFFGAIFLTVLESFVSSIIREYLILIGLSFVLIVILFPNGLYGFIQKSILPIIAFGFQRKEKYNNGRKRTL